MSSTPPITTLIVDDEIDMRILVRMVLELATVQIDIVGEATNGLEALELYESRSPPNDPTVVILDNRMPKVTGLEAAKKILERYPEQIVILYSAQVDDTLRAQAAALGIAHCLSKDELDRIPDVIQQLVGGDPD